jgi:hypothetical protein
MIASFALAAGPRLNGRATHRQLPRVKGGSGAFIWQPVAPDPPTYSNLLPEDYFCALEVRAADRGDGGTLGNVAGPRQRGNYPVIITIADFGLNKHDLGRVLLLAFATFGFIGESVIMASVNAICSIGTNFN